MIQTIHFVRHGEAHNPEKIVYGFADNPLTRKGVRQAELAREHLEASGAAMCPIVSSPVERAHQTAREIHGSFVPTDDRLTEYNSKFIGGKVTDFARERRNWRHLWNPYTASWGERYSDVVSDMEGAVSLALRWDEADVVLVSHQVPIWLYRLHIEGRTYAHDPAIRQCAPGSVTSVDYRQGVPTDIRYWEAPPWML